MTLPKGHERNRWVVKPISSRVQSLFEMLEPQVSFSHMLSMRTLRFNFDGSISVLPRYLLILGASG